MITAKFKMVVFDLAGTVINENNLVYHTIHNVLVNAGYDVSLETVLTIGSGKEKFQAISDILQFKKVIISIAELSLLYHKFLSQLQISYEKLPVNSFPFAEELFTMLHHHQILVVFNTGYNRSTAELLLEKVKWKPRVNYDLLVTSSEVNNGRPSPDMIIRAMAMLGLKKPDKIVKIGDSCADILEGHAAQCGMVIGITTGAQQREDLQKVRPHFIIDSLREVPALLNLPSRFNKFL
jgi:phosphonatase-like hydrolase